MKFIPFLNAFHSFFERNSKAIVLGFFGGICITLCVFNAPSHSAVFFHFSTKAILIFYSVVMVISSMAGSQEFDHRIRPITVMTVSYALPSFYLMYIQNGMKIALIGIMINCGSMVAGTVLSILPDKIRRWCRLSYLGCSKAIRFLCRTVFAGLCMLIGIKRRPSA